MISPMMLPVNKSMIAVKGEKSESNNPRRQMRHSAMASLAEAIILQSIEDLWLEEEKSDCLNFFTGEDFRTCAKLSGMDHNDQVEVLTLVKNVSDKEASLLT